MTNEAYEKNVNRFGFGLVLAALLGLFFPNLWIKIVVWVNSPHSDNPHEQVLLIMMISGFVGAVAMGNLAWQLLSGSLLKPRSAIYGAFGFGLFVSLSFAQPYPLYSVAVGMAAIAALIIIIKALKL